MNKGIATTYHFTVEIGTFEETVNVPYSIAKDSQRMMGWLYARAARLVWSHGLTYGTPIAVKLGKVTK